MDNFFQEENYKLPVTSNYMKFKDGENTFRVLGSAIVGYEYFNTENKPIRSRHEFDDVSDIKKDGTVKHFWAFPVWNYQDERVQILELTQKTIMGFIQSLVNNKRWGNPTGYDITVTKTGSNLLTEYTCIANPHSPLEKHIEEKWNKVNIDLNELYKGGEPFKTGAKQVQGSSFDPAKGEVDIEEINLG